MRVLLAALLAAFLSQATSALALPILSIVPGNQTVSAGQTSSFDVIVSDASDLYAFQFDLGFDPTFIEITSVSEGSFLSAGGGTFFLSGAIDNVGGAVTFTANSLSGAVPGVSGAGVLATIDFKGLSPGVSLLSLFSVVLLDSSLSGQEFDAVGGMITVEPRVAPEPGTMFALGAGLLALGVRARRARRR